MVETAIFSMFHRAPPLAVQSGEDTPEPPAPPEPTVPAGPTAAPPMPEPLPDADSSVDDHPALQGTVAIEAPQPPAEQVEPDYGDADPVALQADSAFEDEMYVSGIQADHELLGLASPEVFSVCASFEGQGAIDLSAAASGIYRPRGFRAAPWSGFAYDQAPNGLTGLAAGTRLLTARGEVPVEGLLPGDAVLALRGPALLPITWVGRSAAAEPPILIEQGALGPNRPRRALCLAPDHPVFVDPLPIAARQLVNGTTIRVTTTHHAELFHVDVGASEVLFAEGVPLSSGNRPGSPAG